MPRNRFILLILLAVVFLIAATGTTSFAADRHVGAGQTYATIAAALAAANNGDRVVVHSGTYTEADITWNKTVDIVEATGETAVLQRTGGVWYVFASGNSAMTWDGIDVVVAGNVVGGAFLSAAANLTVKNMNVTDTAGATQIGYGVVISYPGTTTNIQNVTVNLPNAAIGIGTIFGTPGSGATPVFNISNTNVAVKCAANGAGGLILGGQSVTSQYNCANCSFTHQNVPMIGVGAPMLGGGDNSSYSFSCCTLTATQHTYGLGVDMWYITADRSRFNFNAGYCINAPRIAGWQQIYVNCVWHIGGGSWVANAVLSVPNPNGLLYMYNCTVVAVAIPRDNSAILFSQANVGYNMDLRNNIFALVGTSYGLIMGSGWNAGVMGTNCRCYYVPVPPGDRLGGTIVDGDPALQPDCVHIGENSAAGGRGDNLIGVDYDGDVRPQPAGVKPDLGCDERASVRDVWSSFDPNSPALNEQVISSGTRGGNTWKKVYFTAENWQGTDVRVLAEYSAPTGQSNLPAVLHIHGGGQTYSEAWLDYWNARGYAALTYDHCGYLPGRAEYTLYNNLTQGNQIYANFYNCTSPDVYSNSWYHWNLLARRALTYLSQQSAVNPNKMGIFGVSIGGTMVWPTAAMDSRVKAACPIYGGGWTTYPPNTADPDYYGSDSNYQIWRQTLEPYAYAPLMTCPTLFLNATNDHHGYMDYVYRTLAAVPGTTPLRWAFSPRERHTIDVGEAPDLGLWMDRYLKTGGDLPQKPASYLRLGANGVPELVVTPDASQTITGVYLYYGIESTVPVTRYWRIAPAGTNGPSWFAQLPVMDITKPLYAFGNVYYSSGACVTTDLTTSTAAALGATTPTDSASPTISEFANGLLDAGWTLFSPFTDPISPQVYLQQVLGPGGVWALGLTAACGSSFNIDTYKVGDPKWRGPAGMGLAFRVQSNQANLLRVVVNVNDMNAWGVGGSATYTVVLNLVGSPNWQDFVVYPSQLYRLYGDGSYDMNITLPNWDYVDHLLLRPYAASGNGNEAGTWTGPLPIFAQFHWSY